MRALISLVIVIGLFGCSTSQITYYYPTGDSGEARPSFCNGRIGDPSEYLIKQFTGFKGYVRNYIRRSGGNVELALIIIIGKDTIMEFKSNTIDIYNNGKKHTRRFKKILAWNYGETKLGPDGTIQGNHDLTNQLYFSGKDYEAYQFSATLEGLSDEFTVRFPVFLINSEVVDIGEIHFLKKSGTFWFPGNC